MTLIRFGRLSALLCMGLAVACTTSTDGGSAGNTELNLRVFSDADVNGSANAGTDFEIDRVDYRITCVASESPVPPISAPNPCASDDDCPAGTACNVATGECLSTGDTVDISAVPVVQRMSHLPVVIDPAPASGGEDLIGPLALAGRSVGADGLSVLVHTDPPRSKAGNGSQLDLGSFHRLMDRLGIPSLRDEIDRIDRELVKLLARRQHSSIEIAKIKAQRGLPMRSPDREAELIEEARQDALALDIDPNYIAELMTLVLNHSREGQRRAVGEDG